MEQDTTTSTNASGMSEADAQKLFDAAFNGQDVEVSSPEPTPAPEPVASQTVETDPPKAPPTQGEVSQTQETPANQNPPQNHPYAWVDSIADADLKARVVQELNAKQDLINRYNAARTEQGRLRKSVDEIKALRKQLEELKEAKAQTPAAPTPTQASNTDFGPEFELIRESDPKLAKAIEARARALVAESEKKLAQDLEQRLADRVKAATSPLEERWNASQHERVLQEGQAELLRMIPNAMEIVASPVYQDWLMNHLDEETRHVAIHSTNPRTCANIIKMFYHDTAHVDGVWKREEQQVVAPPTKAPEASTNEADKIAALRNQRLNTGAVIPGSKPTPVVHRDPKIPTTEAEFERAFEEAYKNAKL